MLYDDGFGVDTTHRLAFVTMPAGEAKEPRLVYTTAELPSVFEAQYGDVKITYDGDDLIEEHLQIFFSVKGAYAVIDLGNGQLIGLVDQFHNEDWFVDLKRYSSRYQHRTGIQGLAPDLWDPVTLSLATVYLWDGATWVTDPLQVLKALSDSFVPSAAELERLGAAVR